MHDVIIVGGGIAGLTAGAFLSQSAYSPVIFEKEDKIGGLVNSFERDGFTYDGGIRATENSGILFPMLKKLNLDLEFVKNKITLGIEDRVLKIESEDNIHEYQQLLNSLYPDDKGDIADIIDQIKKIMKYMDVQYGIDNPAFLDVKEDRDYFIKEVFPWMVKYALIVSRINKLNKPVESYLKEFSSNQSLLDIIGQHFFTGTPAFFALSYLKVYLDYYYPLGGTGILPQKLSELILRNYGAISTNTQIVGLDLEKRIITDDSGIDYPYKCLIWAADQLSLYQLISTEELPEGKKKERILHREDELKGKVGNDSVLTLYLAVDLEPDYFSNIASEHFFYSPSRRGESAAGEAPVEGSRPALEGWLKDFLPLSTFEISIPVLRDPSLAPPGKTGLIISLLFDYHLTKRIQDQGWYEDFKNLFQEQVLNILDKSIYPGLKAKVIHQFVSTPLTLEAKTGNLHGAITGWSFTNHPLPAENRLSRIFSATDTPIEGIFQAGQWTYSPSGLPISILTGKLAADRVIKALDKDS